MAIVCRQCGKHNADGVQFCANPDCGAYLGWDGREQTSGVPGVPPPVADTQNASAAVTLADVTLAVDPGDTATTTVTVYNGGSQVEQFAMTVLGPAAAWATVEPATLQVYPAGHAECTVRLAPPREVTTPAGRVWFTVRASSTLHPGLLAGANGTLDVGAFREVGAVLVPQETSGRGRTEHRVDITNAGNVIEPVRLDASDATGKIHFGVPARSCRSSPAGCPRPLPRSPGSPWSLRCSSYRDRRSDPRSQRPTRPAIPDPGRPPRWRRPRSLPLRACPPRPARRRRVRRRARHPPVYRHPPRSWSSTPPAPRRAEPRAAPSGISARASSRSPSTPTCATARTWRRLATRVASPRARAWCSLPADGAATTAWSSPREPPRATPRTCRSTFRWCAGRRPAGWSATRRLSSAGVPRSAPPTSAPASGKSCSPVTCTPARTSRRSGNPAVRRRPPRAWSTPQAARAATAACT